MKNLLIFILLIMGINETAIADKIASKDFIFRVDTFEELNLCLKEKKLANIVFQEMDFKNVESKMLNITFQKCLFLGCKIPTKLNQHLNKDNYILPQLNVPFQLFPPILYNKETLYKDFDYKKPDTYLNSLDKIIYDRYKSLGTETHNVAEFLARSLHDFSIRLALMDFLGKFDEKKIIAIMGGHNMSRKDPMFKQVALLSKNLAENGYLMISGGGPGAMEATHLGVWFAGSNNDDLQNAIDILSEAPFYNDKLWLSKAFQVLEKYPNTKYPSLSIPTWFYGHEPPTPFATHIAKLFENSLREEGLLAIAKGGIVYAPGSAGTIQEIFQDLAQNHYESYGYASPMIFLNKDYWTKERPIYPLIKQLLEENKINKKISIDITDDIEEIIKLLSK